MVTFVMPMGFTASTLPAPTDPRIEIRTEPARLTAAGD
ncbi:MAG: heme-binding protein [Chromatiaceae bacterium]|nr:heme-binding protein [Chromatiaceae bacterium]MBP6734543.1 heme-binding protein [Chromatiaceae bacterium]MBP6806882.1 heme-binding protein [Chromatiaceae bacterium]MBP8284338.1 heme-binding protein [Chromatiaceae bacterium]MBP8288954.1 heme-binding protein [Chromatiaceae bacterium]